MTHICVSKLTIIGSDNGLSPEQRQAIIWTNVWILLIRLLGTNFNEILIGIQTFSFKKMHLKMASAKWRPFCLGLNVLNLHLHHYKLMNFSSNNSASAEPKLITQWKRIFYWFIVFIHISIHYLSFANYFFFFLSNDFYILSTLYCHTPSTWSGLFLDKWNITW